MSATPSSLSFDVLGAPAPQGSKRHVGNNRMVESSKKVGPWRDAVAWTARQNMPTGPAFTGPTRVDLHFRLPMPHSRPAADRKRGWCWSTRRPDIDKLTRSTLDALVTAGVLSDDAIVCELHVDKVEVLDAWTGCSVSVAAVREVDA